MIQFKHKTKIYSDIILSFENLDMQILSDASMSTYSVVSVHILSTWFNIKQQLNVNKKFKVKRCYQFLF